MVTEVRVEFIGRFTEVTGLTQIMVNVEGQATLESLIEKLANKFGMEFERRVLEGGKLSDEVLVILNGRSIRPVDIGSVVLNHGDSLVLAPESAP